MFSRRHLLLGSLGAAAISAAPLSMVLADAPTDRRFVFIVLRGAMDGLAAVPPYGDANYRNLRGALALAEPGQPDGVLDLGGFYGLHPKLTNLKAWYDAGEMLPIQAVATPYRDRSHFDGQDLLENGTATPHGANDGWLNRTLAVLGGQPRLGLAVGDQMPLVIRGKVEVASWAPTNLPKADSGFLALVEAMYRTQKPLADTLQAAFAADDFATRTLGETAKPDNAQMASPPSMQAAAGQMTASQMPGGGNSSQPAAGVKPSGRPGGPQRVMFEAAGKMLADTEGPRIAVLDVGGWDTHTGQGTVDGRLGGNLAQLNLALGALHDALGSVWRKTVIMAATEFGRTAAPNGTGGTDHGTASASFLMGGAVKGGRVLADWPGLAPNRLYQNRDLAPSLDLRAVAKAVLHDHLRIGETQLASRVFPGSAGIAPARGLIRV